MMGKKESNPAPEFPKPPAPPSPPRVDLIDRAAVDWVRDEVGRALALAKANKLPKQSVVTDRLCLAFTDGAYWAIAQIEAGRIKVKVKGES